MCGIAGAIDRFSGVDDTLAAMLQRVEHRGRDGSGRVSLRAGEWMVGLAHRRLSIIDVEGGKQPFDSADQSGWLTFNGEIYNFLELKEKLLGKGIHFSTRSDTEVLLAHLQAFGEGGLSLLNGMFAFAFWDSREERLILARDRVGIKPLYYCEFPEGGIAFASELTALLAHPKVPRVLDTAGLCSYFFSDYIPAPRTILKGVRKLEAGHYIVWQGGKLSRPKLYWLGIATWETEMASRGVAHEPVELGALLEQAVRQQLISDVPVGVLLSGGIDSSLIAAFAARNSAYRLKTFTIAFRDRDYDESAYARMVSRYLHTEHIEHVLDEEDLLECLEAALDCLDEPMADPSLLPTFLLSRLASGHVKVALGGDGGDELFAGYPTYLAHRLAQVYTHFPKALQEHCFKPSVSMLPVRHSYQSLEWKLKRFIRRWDDDPGRRHLRWMSNTDLPELKSLMPSCGSEPEIISRYGRANDSLNSLLALDFQTYLPGSVLTKVDRASMANGLEVRPPFLDNDVVRWAFALPSRYKLKGKTTKYILRRCAEPFLPEAILRRRKKGFSIPLSRWVRGSLDSRIAQILEASPLWTHSPLSRTAFAEGRLRHAAGKEDFSKPLWALIVLDHWLKKERLHEFSRD